MKKVIMLAGLSAIAIQIVMCDTPESPTHAGKNQYVVLATIPDSVNTDCWFNVVDIKTNIGKCVYAVKEIEGSYYLPIYSRNPAFNNKVIEGIFIEDSVLGMVSRDTIFAVTKILRDTTNGFPH